MCNEIYEEPVSAEVFTRQHPAMIDAIRMAVRKELETSQANGFLSGDVHCPFDLREVTKVTEEQSESIGEIAENILLNHMKQLAEAEKEHATPEGLRAMTEAALALGIGD